MHVTKLVSVRGRIQTQATGSGGPALKQSVVCPWIDTWTNGVGSRTRLTGSSLSTPPVGSDLCSGIALHRVLGPLKLGGLNTLWAWAFLFGECALPSPLK